MTKNIKWRLTIELQDVDIKILRELKQDYDMNISAFVRKCIRAGYKNIKEV